jgi:hypothetical protein
MQNHLHYATNPFINLNFRFVRLVLKIWVNLQSLYYKTGLLLQG